MLVGSPSLCQPLNRTARWWFWPWGAGSVIWYVSGVCEKCQGLRQKLGNTARLAEILGEERAAGTLCFRDFVFKENFKPWVVLLFSLWGLSHGFLKASPTKRPVCGNPCVARPSCEVTWAEGEPLWGAVRLNSRTLACFEADHYRNTSVAPPPCSWTFYSRNASRENSFIYFYIKPTR